MTSSIILSIVLIVLLVLYCFGFFRGLPKYRVKNFPSPEMPNFIFTIATLTNSLITEGKVTGFWVGASDIFAARLNAIRSAKYSIQFETYIMTPGRHANDFAEAIVTQAKKGVKIQIIVDAYGAKSINKSYWKELQIVGVEILFFNPLKPRDILQYLHRNHRKLLVIDGKLALVGGAGISDYWDGINEPAPWLDYEVSFEGEIAAKLKGIFQKHWLDLGGIVDFNIEPLNPVPFKQQQLLVTIGENPNYRNSPIRNLFKTSVLAARERIWIASPYFLPNPSSVKLLIDAKRRGVEIKILTMGERTDKKYIHYTSRELYGNLLKEGIEIYEHQPSMMHAKVILIDRNWVSIGSSNFDPRSFFRNDELNISQIDRKFAQQIEEFFINGFSQSLLVSKNQWRRRSLWEKLIGRFWLLFYWQL
ncbi:MAG: cardiolipin synthase B [Okeania sp. SIO2F4]|nr:cardiolipin synthase B [Okeania sp. SIO2F4]